MTQQSITRNLIVSALLSGLSGCAAMQGGKLEVLNPRQAYGKSLAIIGGLHPENRVIQARLSSDLKDALAKRGFTVADDPAQADLVVLPTLGRMRQTSTESFTSSHAIGLAEPSAPVAAVSPAVAAPPAESRPFNRFSADNLIKRDDLVSHMPVPSARAPASAQQAGLLLSAYLAKDYADYGIGRQSLPPIWRIYVSQPVVQLRWSSVAEPLISAAASAAAPLASIKNEEIKKPEQRPEPGVTRSGSEQTRQEKQHPETGS